MSYTTTTLEHTAMQQVPKRQVVPGRGLPASNPGEVRAGGQGMVCACVNWSG
jgi:hypothetical protein